MSISFSTFMDILGMLMIIAFVLVTLSFSTLNMRGFLFHLLTGFGAWLGLGVLLSFSQFYILTHRLGAALLLASITGSLIIYDIRMFHAIYREQVHPVQMSEVHEEDFFGEEMMEEE